MSSTEKACAPHETGVERSFGAPARIGVVSGLPRAGTSLVMQLLAAAGLPIAADSARAPDPDNPRGYFERAAVKGIRQDRAFLDACRGKVVKVVAPLLLELPRDGRYRVLFVERALEEVLASQRVMLLRAGRGSPSAAEDAALERAYRGVLAKCRAWLEEAEDAPALFVEHRALLEAPAETVDRILHFLGQTSETGLPPEKTEMDALRSAMLRVVEPALYRSRAGI